MLRKKLTFFFSEIHAATGKMYFSKVFLKSFSQEYFSKVFLKSYFPA